MKSHVWYYELLVVVNTADIISHTRKNVFGDVLVAPCKGIQGSLGFWIPCGGFRIPDSSTVDSGFQKELDSIFFPVLMLFFALRFRVRILLYWKTLLEGITSFFSFSIYKITGRNVLQFRKGLWHNNGGDIGDSLHRNTAEKNNKHRITAKKRGETPTSQFKVLSYD